MLTLYKSSRLNTLFDAWSDLISQPSPGGPLRPRSVIVPNMDMAQWLQVHQAERIGISANIDFQLPAGYFRKIFEAGISHKSGLNPGAGVGSVGTMSRSKVGAGLGAGTESAESISRSRSGSGSESELESESIKSSKSGIGSGVTPGSPTKHVQTQLLDKHQLRWMAFTLLGEALETGQYPREWDVLVEWIKTSSQKMSGSRDMKGVRWDLAGQIADVFDQYIMYRPQWLREWAGVGVMSVFSGKKGAKDGSTSDTPVSGGISGSGGISDSGGVPSTGEDRNSVGGRKATEGGAVGGKTLTGGISDSGSVPSTGEDRNSVGGRKATEGGAAKNDLSFRESKGERSSTSIVGLEGMNEWQPTFWAMIRSRWGEYPNRADLMLDLVDELGGGAEAFSEKTENPTGRDHKKTSFDSKFSHSNINSNNFPPQIVIFGVQSVAPILMEALLLKSNYTDVHWFQRNNESVGAFSDDFLVDLSVDQRDQSNLMFQLIAKHKIQVNTIILDAAPMPSTSETTTKIDPTKTNNNQDNYQNDKRKAESTQQIDSDSVKSAQITKAYQSDIFDQVSDSQYEDITNRSITSERSTKSNLTENNNPKPSVPGAFPSLLAKPGAISIHRCHSPRREVEVLHDSLLHLFETRNIRPGDVAIVTPDVDLYAPFVREVFQTGSSDQVRIPIRISGGQLNERELAADVLLKALDITNSRFIATEILDWLGLAPVLGDFLDETGLRGTLNRWIEEQRIRWGSGQSHIKDIGFELDGRHSWLFGLQRILLARIASEDQDVIFDGQLSGSAITSKNENILLGRLLTIISALDEFRILSKSTHSMSDWSNLFQDLLDTLIVSKNWIEKCDKIRSILHGMKNLNDVLLSEDLPLEIARDYLKLRLESGGLGRAWHPGFVTFTGMVALHQFPYKVVAMIGLNDGSLPGRTPITAFDLLSKNHLPGDRIRRQADRQMFLDYLITTEDVLHISYTGLRQTDNKQVAPSVMVTALIDNLNRWSRKYGLATPVQVEHRLQPFHSSYFDGSGTSKSYSKYYAEIAKKLQGQHEIRGSIIPELKPGQNLSLNEILSDDVRLKLDSGEGFIEGIGVDFGQNSNKLTPEAREELGADLNMDKGNSESESSNIDEARLESDPVARVNAALGTDGTSQSGNPQAATIQISLSDLVTFYNNPVKYTLRNGYGIDLFESDVPDEDVEPFDLNALDKLKIRTTFYQHLIDEIKSGGVSRSFDSKMIQSMSTRLNLEGILPDAIAGRKSFDSVIDELTQIWSVIQSDDMMDFSSPLVRKMITQDVKIEEIVDVKVSAEIDICVNNVYFVIEAGSKKQKKILQHWIHHVLLNCESPVKTRIYFKDQKRIDFAELTIEEASLRLHNLLLIRILAEQFLIPIFPECSAMYLNSVENGDEPDSKNVIHRIIDATTGDPGMFASDSLTEISSPWIGHAWAEQHPLTISYSLKNLTPDKLSQPSDFIIKMSDFDEYDAFSVISVKLFGLMKGDLK